MAKYLSLSQLLSRQPSPAPKPLYSLYKKNGYRWERCAETSFHHNTACFVFQDRLYNGWKAGINLAIRRVDFN